MFQYFFFVSFSACLCEIVLSLSYSPIFTLCHFYLFKFSFFVHLLLTRNAFHFISFIWAHQALMKNKQSKTKHKIKHMRREREKVNHLWSKRMRMRVYERDEKTDAPNGNSIWMSVNATIFFFARCSEWK